MSDTSSSIVLKVALPVPLRCLFDYLPPVDAVPPRPGMRVLVPFGRRKLVGVVIEITNGSDLPLEKLATVSSIPDGDKKVLTAETLELLAWCWHYYQHAPGEVVFNALPPLLRKLDGEIPALPLQYHISAGGRKRLSEPVGRIKAQLRLLQAIADGSQAADQLRLVSPSWNKTLQRLIAEDWVEERASQAPELKLSSGPELLDEGVDVIHGAVLGEEASA
mgnify:CR=1 FL=1